MEMQEQRAPLIDDAAPASRRQSGIRPPQHEELAQTEMRKLLNVAARPSAHKPAMVPDQPAHS